MLWHARRRSDERRRALRSGVKALPALYPIRPAATNADRPVVEPRGRVQLRPKTTPTEDTFHVMPDVPQSPTPGPASASASRPALGRLWLAGYAILCGALLLVLRYSFLEHPTELVDLWKISDGDIVPALLWLVAMGLVTAGWLLAIRAARGIACQDAWLPVVGISALVLIAFALAYPATAIDVYIYAARSHLLTDYGLDPSTVSPDRLWDFDAYVQYASQEWADDTSPYGPLWNLIAAPATAFDGERIEVAVLIFKAIMVAGTVATAALIHDIARRVQPDLALAATLAWLWCPIVLWEGLANAHNDVLLIMLVVAALWCWVTRHEGGVVPLLGAAALLKVVAVMLIPAAIVAIAVRTGWNRRLLAIAGQTALLSLAALWVAFAPFYDIVGTLQAIQSQRDVWVTSPALLIATIKDELGYTFDFGPIYARFSTAVIVLLTLGGVAVAWRRPDALARIGYEQLFWFLLLATSNLRPWYVIWLVALAAVLPLGMPMVRAGAWAIGAMASYYYTSWIQNWGDPTWLERVSTTVAIMLVPVLAVTIWGGIRALRRDRLPAEVPTSTNPIPEM